MQASRDVIDPSKPLPTARDELAAIVRRLVPGADVSTLHGLRRGKRETEIKIVLPGRQVVRIDYDDHQRLRGWYACSPNGRGPGRIDTVDDLTRCLADCLRR